MHYVETLGHAVGLRSVRIEYLQRDRNTAGRRETINLAQKALELSQNNQGPILCTLIFVIYIWGISCDVSQVPAVGEKAWRLCCQRTFTQAHVTILTLYFIPTSLVQACHQIHSPQFGNIMQRHMVGWTGGAARISATNLGQLTKEDEASAGNEDMEVRREDQEKINKFSSLHQKEEILEEELKAKIVGIRGQGLHTISG